MAKIPKNPFILIGFVSRDYFCDRKQELAFLMDNYLNERNIVLYSWRRMGKTSLIRCFFHMLEQQKDAETIYVDLMSTRNMQDAIKAITQTIHHRYGRTSKGFSEALGKLIARLGMTISFDPASGMPKLEFGLGALPPPEESLTAMGEFLSKRRKRVIIAFDEFQQIGHYPEGNAESVFRSWMQSFPGIRMIFSGSHRNMMRSMFMEQNRPFYKSTQLLELQPIALEIYREFIKHQFSSTNIPFEDELIDEVYRWSRSQTYTIQLICNKLYGNRGRITESSIQQVYYEIIEQQKHLFSNYSKLFTNTQWDVLKAIAISEPATSIYSNDFLTQHNLGAASSVRTALNFLLQKEIVIEDDGQYLLHDVIFARWLQQPT